MRILLTGATGFIGLYLTEKLLRAGHELFAFSRNPSDVFSLPPSHVFLWDDQAKPDKNVLTKVEAVIHLAGESLATSRWTKARKQRLSDSRISGTRQIVSAISELSPAQRPKIFISASAVGFYGDTADEVVDETSQKGQGFLADLCAKWEESALTAQSLGLRTVLLRFGLVLGRGGGVTEKLAPVVLGDGRQWMSWIHIEDLANFILKTIEDHKMEGIYNLTAPYPRTNSDFTNAFAKSLSLPLLGRAPKALLKTILGEMSEMVLTGQKVLPVRTLESGFHFKFENLESALNDIFPNNSVLDNYLNSSLFIPKGSFKVFDFFSTAENLEQITPPWINFKIVAKSSSQIQKNSLLEYKLNIHGIPIRWKTLISEWSPEERFTDDQLSGPYKLWHHEHEFFEVTGGTLIKDRVTYRLPGSFIGKIFFLPIVRRDVQEIFRFRQLKIRELAQKQLSL